VRGTDGTDVQKIEEKKETKSGGWQKRPGGKRTIVLQDVWGHDEKSFFPKRDGNPRYVREKKGERKQEEEATQIGL